ncbi:MAG: ribonucleoside-diphosphate reductase subunit alpha [Ardenticatenales bacterium]
MHDLKVIKRNGEVVDFDAERIAAAIAKAVSATGVSLPEIQVHAVAERACDEVEQRFVDFFPNVENVQDIVEKHLMREGLYDVAKAYILYRANRQNVREAARAQAIESAKLGKLTVVKRDGRTVLFNVKPIAQTVRRLSQDLALTETDVDDVVREVVHNVYDGIPTSRIEQAMVMAAATFIEREPAFSALSARLLFQKLRKEVVGHSLAPSEVEAAYRQTFIDQIRLAVREGQFDPRLAEFDLDRMAAAIDPVRDGLFQYLGAQTLYERYFARRDGRPFELPQAFWMRVAMGLSVDEADREGTAIRFYNLISSLRYVPSTPTLFHAGTSHPQLSSCYITTVDDDLSNIFKSYADNAQLSKWSGGLGNDWTNVRGTGAAIHSTHVESQGVIPFLKIANDVTMAINRSGKRRGATCAYLETWHYDIEDFLDLRRNTGDERRRAHDMNTANWIPDLFIQRVIEDGPWTLFSPDEVPDLHDTFGRKFAARYAVYEAMAARGEIALFKTLQARTLWRKMLTMLFETGHPWITFKDPCNVRSPQDHVGVVHSSNLCTEITLNTSRDETAVCNLGSVNLGRHVVDGKLDEDLIADTVSTAIRMLDNVIDINYYPTPEARASNLRHRPIGLGVMGFQDMLYGLGCGFSEPAALEWADYSMELVSRHAILASSHLAAERGAYPSYAGSKWDRGLFPVDTLDLLASERGMPIEVSRTRRLDWSPVYAHVKAHGMRNSNTMAIAPTATISNIAGCYPSIEPIFKNLYVKANISGEFVVVNHYLVDDLKALGLWDRDMLDELKFRDGSLEQMERIPKALRLKYQEAFEVDPAWMVQLAAARGKWIDQSQSLNVFLRGTSGKQLADVYLLAWRMGLKTTYYLRTMAVSGVEKSTLDAAKFGFTQMRDNEALSPADARAAEIAPAVAPAAAPAPARTAAPVVADIAPIAPASMPAGGAIGGVRPAVYGNGNGNGHGNGHGHARNGDANGPTASLAVADANGGRADAISPKLCRIDDPECEACQ